MKSSYFDLIAKNHTINPSTDKNNILKEFLENYPTHEWWRLFVDGFLYQLMVESDREQENGWHGYEGREPGSLLGCFVAWLFCLLKLNFEDKHLIDIEFIAKLQELLAETSRLNKGFRSYAGLTNHVGFCFINEMKHCYTLEGCRDLLQSIKSGKLPNAYVLLGPEEKNNNISENLLILKINRRLDDAIHAETLISTRELLNLNELEIVCIKTLKTMHDKNEIYICLDNLNYKVISELKKIDKDNVDIEEDARALYKASQLGVAFYSAPCQIDHKLNASKILDTYNQQINEAKSDDEKLLIIGETIVALERSHPFPDCNGRTFVNLLLNYLLIANGFPPATFFEPNVFDAFSNTIDILKTGMHHTTEIYHKKKLFGFDQGELDKQKINNMVADAVGLMLKNTLDSILKELITIKYISESKLQAFTFFQKSEALEGELKKLHVNLSCFEFLIKNKNIYKMCLVQTKKIKSLEMFFDLKTKNRLIIDAYNKVVDVVFRERTKFFSKQSQMWCLANLSPNNREQKRLTFIDENIIDRLIEKLTYHKTPQCQQLF